MTVDEIVQEALALPHEDRTRVVKEILHSLEPHDAVRAEPEWEQAWDQEIERRVRDLDEGRATAISHEEFQGRVRSRLPQP